MTVESALDKIIEQKRDELIGLALDLIGCQPTYTDGSNGIAKAQALMEAALMSAGMRVERLATPEALERHPLYVPADAMRTDLAGYRPEREPIVRARIEVDPSLPTLALSGHIDVEPVDPEEWHCDEWAHGCVRGNRLYGRGASDMLGALAAFAVSVDAVMQLDGPAANIEVHCVPGEELGGNGTLALLSCGPVPDYVIIGEPTELVIAEATLGFHHFIIESTGRRVHMAEALGDGAIERAAHIILSAEGARAVLADDIRTTDGFESYSGNPLTFGRITAGTDAAVPPVTCRLEGAALCAPGTNREQVLRTLGECINAAGDGGTVGLSAMSFAGNAPCRKTGLAEALERALRKTGVTVVRSGFPSPCDLRLYTTFGSSGVVCGPGALAQAHAPDEHLCVEALITYTRTLGHFLSRFGSEP
jgi:acetylornithine deacetylase